MATVHLTDQLVRSLEPPTTGNRITYDDTVKGLGARVTSNGARAFILTYSVRGSGRQRRYTIGGCDRWTATDARAEARRLKALVDAGGDPLRDLQDEREAPTMADLIACFREEHFPRLRPSTRADYTLMLKGHVVPFFGERRKVRDVVFADVDRLHRRITEAGHGYRANRVLALVSKMFALAVVWGWRETNPCKGIKRNREHHRRRYLMPDELARLTKVLAEEPDRDFVDIIRLLLLTGARRGEVRSMKWADLDLGAGTWSKPPSGVKQHEHHQVPLSAPARQILAERLARKTDDSEFVFPGDGSKGHLMNVWRAWRRLLEAAGITGLRLHDLRHSFASELVSGGASLPLIGALLGHSNPATTSRYSHLYTDVQVAAVERVGAAVMNAGKTGSAEVTPLKKRRRS
jgi:integrase